MRQAGAFAGRAFGVGTDAGGCQARRAVVRAYARRAAGCDAGLSLHPQGADPAAGK